MELSTIIQSERIERPEEDETVVAESLEMSSAIGKYKGFSTSMDDLFSEPEDCCMFLSCGILLSSRSRYLFRSEHDPERNVGFRSSRFICRAILRHVFVPLLFLYLSIMFIFTPDYAIIGYLLVISCIVYIVVDMRMVRASRARFRLAMLTQIRSNNATQSSQYSSATSSERNDILRNDILQGLQDKNLSHRAHGICCGCYPTDDDDCQPTSSTRSIQQGQQYHVTSTNDIEETQEEQLLTTVHQKKYQPNFCTNIWKFVSSLCCGKLCGCWCMSCGVCALAQEAREIRRMIPKSSQAIDFYTFQLFSEYYPQIIHLRSTANTSFSHHIKTLSLLSHRLLRLFVRVLIIYFIYATFDIDKHFTLENMIVVSFIMFTFFYLYFLLIRYTHLYILKLLATFLQAFTILYFVQWRNNRFIVSLDATIKYFAVGYIFSTALAGLFEQILEVCFAILYIIPNIIIYKEEVLEIFNQTQSSTRGRGLDYDYSVNDDVDNTDTYSSTGDTAAAQMIQTIAKRHPIIFITYYFFTSYIVAAVTEEMCKYFGYLVLKHPDSIEGINTTTANPEIASPTENQLEMTTINGEIINTTLSAESLTIDDREHHEQPEEYTISNSTPYQQSVTIDSLETVNLRTMINMVTVATGFACCENISYIFGLSGGNINTEIRILVLRSLLPVHPICAAIQSIGVSKRNLLYNYDTNSASLKSKYNIGRVILPAVILHGSFDFFLFLIGYLSLYFCGEVIEEKEKNDVTNFTCSDEMYSAINVLGYVVPFLFVIGGIVYYIVQSRILKKRLREIDLSSTTSISGLL